MAGIVFLPIVFIIFSVILFILIPAAFLALLLSPALRSKVAGFKIPGLKSSKAPLMMAIIASIYLLISATALGSVGAIGSAPYYAFYLKEIKPRVAGTQIKKVTEREPIPFETIEEEDPTLPKGETEVEQEGIEGEKLVTYAEEYVNGKLKSRRKIKEEIIKEPVDEIILVGALEPEEREESEEPQNRLQLEEYAISLWQEITCTMPTQANLNWAVEKLLAGWPKINFYNYLRQTSSFKARYPEIPYAMSCKEYDRAFAEMNAHWLRTRGRPLTREEFARILRGEYIPLDE